MATRSARRSHRRSLTVAYGPDLEHRGRPEAAAHEDPQFRYQLSHAGLRILWCPEALGFHYQMTSFEETCQRRYLQDLNFAASCFTIFRRGCRDGHRMFDRSPEKKIGPAQTTSR